MVTFFKPFETYYAVFKTIITHRAYVIFELWNARKKKRMPEGFPADNLITEKRITSVVCDTR